MGTKTDVMPTQSHLFDKPSGKESICPGSRPSRSAEVARAMGNRGWAFLRVSGKSMLPWIREGDIVFLRRTRILEIVRGDVVVFERNGTTCVHRVLAIRGGVAQGERNVSLITKGDATADADAPVSSDEFRGKVEFVYRRNREIRIASGWRRHFGKVLAFLSPATSLYRRFSSKRSSDSARCERSLSPMDGQRSSENSAD